MTTENGQQERRALALTTIDDVTKLGTVMVQSGFFKDSKTAAQAVVKILAGRELGIGPVRSMNDVFVIEGKTALSYSLIGSLIKGSGRYNYRIKEHSDQACSIEFFEGGQSMGVSTFAMQDAERAGLAQKAIWKQYPKNMLLARAMSNGARMYCPDVFGGSVYTPDEFDVIEGEAREVSAAPIPHVEQIAEPRKAERPVVVRGEQTDAPQQHHFWTSVSEFYGLKGEALADRVHAALGVKSIREEWLNIGKTWEEALAFIKMQPIRGQESKE